jgi:hypothetical protein
MKIDLSFDTAELTFCTTANKKYLNFVEPFIAFCTESNPDCKIEIWVDSPSKFTVENSNVRIHQLPKNYHVATYRYVLEPSFQTLHTYITDIDIMHTEYVQPFHITHMNQTGLPFSNIRRDKKGRTNRLSGLHFVETIPWYQKTKETREKIIPKGQDEEMLFQIVDSVWNITDVSNGLANRPVHGIHCSTEGKPRNPYSKLGWEITSQKVAFFIMLLKNTAHLIPTLEKTFVFHF